MTDITIAKHRPSFASSAYLDKLACYDQTKVPSKSFQPRCDIES